MMSSGVQQLFVRIANRRPEPKCSLVWPERRRQGTMHAPIKRNWTDGLGGSLMRVVRLALLALPVLISPVLISVAPLQAQQPNWSQIEEETMRHFQAILRLDTSNPPGNETLVVEYLKSVLDKEGIETKVFRNDPKRANLVARLRGNGKK